MNKRIYGYYEKSWSLEDIPTTLEQRSLNREKDKVIPKRYWSWSHKSKNKILWDSELLDNLAIKEPTHEKRELSLSFSQIPPAHILPFKFLILQFLQSVVRSKTIVF